MHSQISLMLRVLAAGAITLIIHKRRRVNIAI